MGGNTCAVAICQNYASKSKKAQENILFFRFPKDSNIEKQWIQKCRRKDKFKPQNSRICSQHFTRQDFEDDMKARLLNIIPKKLKSSAVPSLNLLPAYTLSDGQINSRTLHDERALAKKQKEIVSTHLASEAPTEEVVLETLPSTSRKSNFDFLKRQCDDITKENESLKKSW